MLSVNAGANASKAGTNAFFSRNGCNFGIDLPSFVSKLETLTLWGCYPVAKYYDVLAGGCITPEDERIELWESREEVVRAENTSLFQVWMCSPAVVYYGKRRLLCLECGKWIFSSDIPLTVLSKNTDALLLKVFLERQPEELF